MKKITLVIVVLLLMLGCDKSEQQQETLSLSCLPTNLQNGVVAYYPFGNGSLNDSSGNNFNLTNPTSASPAMDRGGNPNCAFNFNGNDYLEYVNPTFLNNLPATNLSVSFWYKSDEDTYGSLISRDDTTNCPNYYGIWSVMFVNAMLMYSSNGGLCPGPPIFTNTWNHIVITSNSSLIQFYHNGILISSTNNFTNCPFITTNQGNLFLGKLYDGILDDMVIYNRIISTAEVTQLYNLAPCCN